MDINKSVLFCVFFLTLTFNGKAQYEASPTQITWGQELKQPSSTILSKIIGSDNEGFYTLRNYTAERTIGGTHNIFLEYYNKKMDLKKAQKIDTRFKGKDRDLEDVIKLGNQLWLLTSFNNEAKKKNYLFAQSITLKTLSLKKNITKIGEIDTKNRNKEGFFAHHISRDSNTILIYNGLPYKKGEPEQFSLNVFDNQFNPKWQKDVVMPYRDDLFAVKEYKVDNNGNVHLLGKQYLDKNRGRGKLNYQYVIITYKGDGSKPSQYKIKLDDKFITDFTFEIANDNTLICSGFYSELGIGSIGGTYFFKIDPDSKKVYAKNFKKFDFDFLTEHLTDRRKEKLIEAEKEGETNRSAELPEYALDHIILRNDGGALLVAERYFVYERNNTFNDPYYGGFNSFNNNRFNNRITNYYYHYEDIIIVNIDPKGNIQWTSRIPKRQVSTNDGGYLSSYAMSIAKDKIYFVYNDNAKNLDPNIKRKDKLYSYNGSRSVVTLAQLNTSGDLKYFPLFSSRQADVSTRPKVCKQTGKNEMVIYGERGQKYKFAKVEFQ